MSTAHTYDPLAAALTRRRTDGLSFEDLEAETGISAATLARALYWAPTADPAPHFTELTVEDEPPHPGNQASPIEVHGPLGHRLVLDAATAPERVAALVRALPC